MPIHTYASSLGGDTSSKVLALRLSHLVDGSRLEAIELAEGRSLRRKTWIKRERMSQDVDFFKHIVLLISIKTIEQHYKCNGWLAGRRNCPKLNNGCWLLNSAMGRDWPKTSQIGRYQPILARHLNISKCWSHVHRNVWSLFHRCHYKLPTLVLARRGAETRMPPTLVGAFITRVPAIVLMLLQSKLVRNNRGQMRLG